jgi:hypothetical protein
LALDPLSSPVRSRKNLAFLKNMVRPNLFLDYQPWAPLPGAALDLCNRTGPGRCHPSPPKPWLPGPWPWSSMAD